MITILILYTIGAVATYGWAMALEPEGYSSKRDKLDQFVSAVVALIWPVSVPAILLAGHYHNMPLWQGWRLR
jgi:hypothetical protein